MTEETKQEEVECIKPRWIPEKEDCFWCCASASIDVVELPKDGECVILRYKCKNEECTYPLSGNYEFGFKWTGEQYVKQMKEYNRNNKVIEFETVEV